jgi:NADP-dependent aldehyde dehydrogenase
VTTTENSKLQSRPLLASTSGNNFINNPNLHEEVFGPFSLVVKCKDKAELKLVVEKLKGQLTATVIAEENEIVEYSEIIESLSNKVGRIIFNGVPTGVEVCPSMHHGGPYPASSDSKFTAVGVDAITRFVRPLSYQNWPENLLPDELKNSNPLGIWRTVNGKLSQDQIL